MPRLIDRRDVSPDPSRDPDDAADWPVGHLVAEADGALRAVNAAATELLARLGPDPVAPNLFAQLRDVAPDLRAAMARARLRGGRLTRDLRARDAAAALTLTTRPGGVLVGFLVDETPRLRAEAEAERQRARFAALADAPSIGAVFTLDPHGRISGWSRSAERLEGLSAPEALGASLETLFGRGAFPGDSATLVEAAARAGEASISGLFAGGGRATGRHTLTLRAVRAARGELDGFVAHLRPDETARPAREAELRRLAETDPLTGLMNRRAFMEAAAATLDAAEARAEAVALALLDVDDFKRLNDDGGHQAGDAALRAVAEAARTTLRDGDLIGRLGGDEFALALPRADRRHATLVAERLRCVVAALRPDHRGRLLRVTASLGVAARDRPGEPLAALLARADAALYAAKAAGKDRARAG